MTSNTVSWAFVLLGINVWLVGCFSHLCISDFCIFQSLYSAFHAISRLTFFFLLCLLFLLLLFVILLLLFLLFVTDLGTDSLFINSSQVIIECWHSSENSTGIFFKCERLFTHLSCSYLWVSLKFARKCSSQSREVSLDLVLLCLCLFFTMAKTCVSTSVLSDWPLLSVQSTLVWNSSPSNLATFVPDFQCQFRYPIWEMSLRRRLQNKRRDKIVNGFLVLFLVWSQFLGT